MRRALILVGPSAVGKTTVMAELLRLEPRFSFVRSATTRSPRNDGHDAEYLYLSRDEFIIRAEHGEMLEYMEYAENLYGTPKSEIDRIFSTSNLPLLILDIKGVRSMRSLSLPFEAVAVYLYTSEERLIYRLNERCNVAGRTPEAIAVYEKRVKQNSDDYISLPGIVHLFDALVENTTPYETAERILRIFNAEREEKNSERENAIEVAKLLSERAKNKTE